MSEIGKRDVVIVGGGIGGLGAALCLARAGLSSCVLERRAVASEDGAGIQIGPNGTRVLRDLGLLEVLEPFAAVPGGIVVRRGADGRELVRLPLGRWMATRHGAPYLVVHRVDLHKVLYDAALADPMIDVGMDCDVASVENTDDGVVAHVVSGGPVCGQVLVGADGIWSRVRSFVVGGASGGREDGAGTVADSAVAPKFLGKSAARAVLPISDVDEGLARNDVTVWMHPNGHVVHYPIRGGRALAAIAVVDDETAREQWGTNVSASWLERRTNGFDHRVRGLVTLGGDQWRVWGLHVFEMPRRWSSGRVVLLGDAAHPILPFLAQGGVMALEDAKVLADSLAGTLRPGEQLSGHAASVALLAYERARRDRVLRVQERSARQGRIFHMDGLGVWGRDIVLRFVGGAQVMKRYDWLYGWRG